MISIDGLLNKLGLTKEKLTSEEKETFTAWEEVMKNGNASEELFKNEAFKKGLEVAEIRLFDLISQLINPENEEKKNNNLKAEINHILNTFALFGGAKKNKEALEKYIKQRME